MKVCTAHEAPKRPSPPDGNETGSDPVLLPTGCEYRNWSRAKAGRYGRVTRTEVDNANESSSVTASLSGLMKKNSPVPEESDRGTINNRTQLRNGWEGLTYNYARESAPGSRRNDSRNWDATRYRRLPRRRRSFCPRDANGSINSRGC